MVMVRANIRIVSALIISLSSLVVDAAELHVSWVMKDLPLNELTISQEFIESLVQSEIITSTPWTQEIDSFIGPTLATLSELFLPKFGRISGATVSALNGYSMFVPAEDWEALNVIVASRINGAQFKIYDKGPFWVIYPLDEMSRPADQIVLSRMVWHVSHVEFHVE